MRGQEYKAQDKTVRKMSRDGLLEENLHTRDTVRISQRELDVLELSGQEKDSVNFQDIRYHRMDERTEGREQRRWYVPDSIQSNSENTEVSVPLEDHADSDDGQCMQKVHDGAIQQENQFQPEPEIQPETNFRQETRFQMESESDQDTKFPAEIRQKRRKRQLYEIRNTDTKQENQNSLSIPETLFTESPETPTEIPDFKNEKSPLESEAAFAGKLSDRSSRMEQIWEDSSGNFQHSKTSPKKIRDRKKKQVYEYARREKKKKEPQEIQKAVLEKEKTCYEKNLEWTEQGPFQEDRKKCFSRLSFQDEEKGMVRSVGMGIARKALSFSLRETAAFLHEKEQETEEENTAAESAHKTGLAGERIFKSVVRISGIAMEKRCSNKAGAVEMLETKNRLQFRVPMEEQTTSERLSAETEHAKKRKNRKYQQKQRIKRFYQEAKRGRQTAGDTIKVTETVFDKAKRIVETFFQKKKGVFVAVGVLGLSLVVVSSGLSSCGAMIQGASPTVIGTTYPSTDTDIYAVDAAYTALEDVLDQQINNMESTHPGYDEYRYQVDEISHNPYHLISYLSVVHQEFTYNQVKEVLPVLFSEQFRLTVEEVVETRTRTETHTSTDPVTGEVTEHEVEVEYDYYILCISLTNRGFDAVARSHLTPGQTELYQIYNFTFGNRNYLFDVKALPPETGGNAGEPGYEIPEEALSDAEFANMIREAEKYLG